MGFYFVMGVVFTLVYMVLVATGVVELEPVAPQAMVQHVITFTISAMALLPFVVLVDVLRLRPRRINGLANYSALPAWTFPLLVLYVGPIFYWCYRREIRENQAWLRKWRERSHQPTTVSSQLQK